MFDEAGYIAILPCIFGYQPGLQFPFRFANIMWQYLEIYWHISPAWPLRLIWQQSSISTTHTDTWVRWRSGQGSWCMTTIHTNDQDYVSNKAAHFFLSPPALDVMQEQINSPLWLDLDVRLSGDLHGILWPLNCCHAVILIRHNHSRSRIKFF